MSVQFSEKVVPFLVPIDSVLEHPENPRRGDLKALKDSIKANGFYSVCLVQDSTGYMIAGNHRRKALLELGETRIPVIRQDMSDEDAKRILLGDNRTSDLAYYDDPSLLRLLESLDGDYRGTGYDEASYQLLLQGLEGDTILGQVNQGNTPEDRLASYLDSDVRSIILPYQGTQYDEVANGLRLLRDRHQLDTNADLVAMLVEDALAMDAAS